MQGTAPRLTGAGLGVPSPRNGHRAWGRAPNRAELNCAPATAAVPCERGPRPAGSWSAGLYPHRAGDAPTVSRGPHSLLQAGALAAVLRGVWLTSAPVPAFAAPVPPAPLADTVLVVGTVDDLSTGLPVAQAAILVIAPSSGARVATAESDSLGDFVFTVPEEGEYLIRVQRLGYGDVEDTVSLDGEDLSLHASMVPEALDLEPVVVTVRRRTSPWMEEFERRRSGGFGSFVTRADLEARRHGRVTDALRQVPGLRIIPGSMGDGQLMMRGRCRPNIFIDGVATDPSLSLDLMLRPDDVEGIEIHSTATVPPQFAHEGCGAVLVWTREPKRVAGTVDWWKPVVVAGVVFGLLIWAR